MVMGQIWSPIDGITGASLIMIVDTIVHYFNISVWVQRCFILPFFRVYQYSIYRKLHIYTDTGIVKVTVLQ